MHRQEASYDYALKGSGDPPKEVVRELHRLADAAMSDLQAWPDVGEKPESIWQMLAQTGFTEEVADGSSGAVRYTVRLTPVVELLLVCVGAVEIWDVPVFLLKHGYASEEEADEVWEATEAEALRLLRLLLLRAYTKRFVRSTSRH
jgi:hypothetical protein